MAKKKNKMYPTCHLLVVFARFGVERDGKQWLACVIGCGDLFFGSFLCFLLMMMWYIMTDILA